MGQAFDESGKILGEALEESFKEVFEKLTSKHPDAYSIQIQKMKDAQTKSNKSAVVGKCIPYK